MDREPELDIHAHPPIDQSPSPMNIDYASFSPATAALGGLLIGLAAAALLATLGRIAGISGILFGMVWGASSDRIWRMAFILGLLAAPGAWTLFGGIAPASESPAELPALIIAGLLVGIGTQLGSGCTSGHGVCGLARRSLRSLAATLSFMTSGFLMVGIIQQSPSLATFISFVSSKF